MGKTICNTVVIPIKCNLISITFKNVWSINITDPFKSTTPVKKAWRENQMFCPCIAQIIIFSVLSPVKTAVAN